MSELLSATSLSKRYGGLTALDGLSLQVEEGSVYGFIGPNGAGKTTAIKILMNIIQPSAGRTSVLGVDSRRIGPAQFERVGYVSENQETPDWMTVGYLLRYLKPFYPTWDDARENELVKLFGLPRDRKLSKLSRGMKMKTMLVSSLAYRPRLLVLDEPFGGLDAVAREDVVDALIDSAAETTIFISSHDLADIETFASHIGYIDNGRLLLSEEMSALTARFREVEVTVEAAPPALPPQQWPSHWLRPQSAGTVVRFIDTRFDESETRRAVQETFGGVLHMAANPMPLRGIFVALARHAARAA
jgi:ABC-2 type transport system ATP-binding protein